MGVSVTSAVCGQHFPSFDTKRFRILNTRLPVLRYVALCNDSILFQLVMCELEWPKDLLFAFLGLLAAYSHNTDTGTLPRVGSSSLHTHVLQIGLVGIQL